MYYYDNNFIKFNFRATFTPIFTSGKMRSMFKFMKEIGSRLNDELNNKAKSGTDFELKVMKRGYQESL